VATQHYLNDSIIKFNEFESFSSW